MTDAFAIYPIYLDSKRKLSKGRKYPLSLCIPNPNIAEIAAALKIMEIEHQIEPTKRHPCDPFIFGRVKVKKTCDKKFIFGGIKAHVEELKKVQVKLKAQQAIVNQEEKKRIC